MAKLGWNPNDHEPQGSFAPLREGWYQCQINSVEVAYGKSKDAGRQVKIGFEVSRDVHGGDGGGRIVFTRLCIYHKLQKTREIACRQLSAICHAIDLLPDDLDTDDLLGQDLMVSFKVKPGNEQYGPSNDASAFAAIGDKEPVAPPSDDDVEEVEEEEEKPKQQKRKKPAWG